MSLEWVGQDDFSVGTLVGIAQDQQPGVGVERAINGIFDDDGDVWRRGAVARVHEDPIEAPLTFLWSGYLGAQYVQLLASPTRFYGLIGADLTPLAAPGLVEPALPAIVDDLIFLPNGFVWGGGAGGSNAGTIAVSQNSPAVVGTGTAFGAGHVGSLLKMTGGRYYRVASVQDATHLTLSQPVSSATAVGQAYTISAYASDALPPATRPRHLGTAAGRLLIAIDNRIAFSKPDDPFSFDPTDYHELPDGVIVQGLSSIRDRALVFTNYGLWTIVGMAFDLTDELGNAQHQLDRLTPELSLLHEAGLAEWAGNIVAPCIDRCFLVDGLSPPVPITDSISSIYMDHIRAGHRPGGAKVFRNHYFLPWLDAARHPHGLALCRLNRPVKARQVYYPWSEWDGYPTGIAAFDVDLRAAPVFRGAHEDGHVVDISPAFPPFLEDETPMVDPDGEPVVFDVETRDFPTGNGQPNHVRRLRLFYYALGTGQIKAAYSFGAVTQRYQDVTASGRTYAEVEADFPDYESLLRGFAVDPDSIEWSSGARFWIPFDPTALEPPGVDPLLWNFEAAERPRFIRARFRSTDGIAQVKLRIVQFACRPTTHQR